MTDTTASLQRKIGSAADLQVVVRTMKAIAASSISQYEEAVVALDDYYRTVQLGIIACLGQQVAPIDNKPQQEADAIIAIVFGSDQGLVADFNEVMVNFVETTLAGLAKKNIIFAIGERVQARLVETSLPASINFVLPNSMSEITPLVGQLLVEIEARRRDNTQVYLFYNRPESAASYTPTYQRLLPLDKVWWHDISVMTWPIPTLPEIVNNQEQTLLALLREYLFVSLFRACAKSLASENASRLAAMQRAEQNINELLDDLKTNFHRLRQSGIDDELFDVISGFEALTKTS